MNEFKIKNFDTMIVDSEILPRNEDGSYNDATSNMLYTNDTSYLVNPFTLLIGKMTGFTPAYWEQYTNTWVDVDFPEPVIQHYHQHYRIMALKFLIKNVTNITNFKKLINVALGYPFSLYEGVCAITTEDDFHTIVQTVGTETVTYKIPDTYTLSVLDGDTLDYFQELIEGITYYDIKSTDWYADFDTDNVIPLVGVQNIDFALNKNRIVAVEAMSYFGYNSKFLGELLTRVLPSNVIFFFKSSSGSADTGISPADVPDLTVWYKAGAEQTYSLDGAQPNHYNILADWNSVLAPTKGDRHGSGLRWDWRNGLKIPTVRGGGITSHGTSDYANDLDPESNYGYGRSVFTAIICVELAEDEDFTSGKYLWSITNGSSSATDDPRYSYLSLLLDTTIGNGVCRIAHTVDEPNANGTGTFHPVLHYTDEGVLKQGLNYLAVTFDGPNSTITLYTADGLVASFVNPEIRNTQPPDGHNYSIFNQKEWRAGGYASSGGGHSYELAVIEHMGFDRLLTDEEKDGIFANIASRVVKVPGTLGGGNYLENGDNTKDIETYWKDSTTITHEYEGTNPIELKIINGGLTDQYTYQDTKNGFFHNNNVVPHTPKTFRATFDYRNGPGALIDFAIWDEDPNDVYLYPRTLLPYTETIQSMSYDFQTIADDTASDTNILRIYFRMVNANTESWVSNIKIEEIYQ